MNRKLRRIVPAVVLAATAVVAPEARGQTIDSPYRFVETSQSASVFGGYIVTGRGALELGPKSAPLVGARYAIRVSGPFSAEGTVAYFASKRTVFDTVPSDTTLRAVGEADLQALAAIVGLRFDVTGPRTWHRLQPYVALSGGLAFDLAPASPDEASLTEDSRFDLGTRFVAVVGGGVDAHLLSRLSFRVDARTMLWKLNTPRTFLLGEPALFRPTDEWTQNLMVSAGLAFRF